ncbi:MAG: hypothetical protein ACK4OP_03940, partial [Gemmobacter sp.]
GKVAGGMQEHGRILWLSVALWRPVPPIRPRIIGILPFFRHSRVACGAKLQALRQSGATPRDPPRIARRFTAP